MKVLVFTDVHGNFSLLNKLMKKSYSTDISICCGDYTFFSKDLFKILKILNRFKNLFFINGNHELTPEVSKLIKEKNLNNFNFVDENYVFFNKILFVGYGGGGFTTRDFDFHKFLSSINIKEIIKKYNQKNSLKVFKPKLKIFISHTPPYGCRQDLLLTGHSGDMFLSSFLKRNAFDYCFCGHFHENFNTIDQIETKINNNFHQITIVNPGPKGLIINI